MLILRVDDIAKARKVLSEMGVKIAKATKAAMGEAYPDAAVDAVVFRMADLGRLGRKANAGFYAYDDKGNRLGLWEGASAEWPVRDARARQRVIDECLLPYLHDRRDAWRQLADGRYERIGTDGPSAQQALMTRYHPD